MFAAALALALSAGPADPPAAQPADPPAGTLRFVGSYRSGVLKDIVSVEASGDGRFVYTASYNARQVGVFARDAATGRLTPTETQQVDRLFDGVTALRPSPDGRRAASAAFRSDAVTLFDRDPVTGRLARRAAVTDAEAPALRWTIDVAWSPDSRFAYAIADTGAAVVVLRAVGEGADARWEVVQTERGRDSCLNGARGVAVSPDGRRLYVVADKAGALSVFDRDPDAGTLTLRQVIGRGWNDGDPADDEPAGRATDRPDLRGVIGVAAGPRFVHTSGGRFRGTHAVTTFRVGPDGELAFVQQLTAAGGGLEDFRGGNEIAVSPDGRSVYAAGTTSDSLAAFRRADDGTLTQTDAILHDEAAGVRLKGASGLTVTADGRHVLVAAEDSNAVTVFARVPAAD